MAKYYYDRRNITAAETQFFFESRMKHPERDIGTNMELDAAFTEATRIKKITVVAPAQLISSAVAQDTTADDQLRILMDEAILQIQVGDLPLIYLPVNISLSTIQAQGFGSYSQTVAADGTYVFLQATNIEGKSGIEVALAVPERVTFKFFLKTSAVPAFGKVTIILECE